MSNLLICRDGKNLECSERADNAEQRRGVYSTQSGELSQVCMSVEGNAIRKFEVRDKAEHLRNLKTSYQ